MSAEYIMKGGVGMELEEAMGQIARWQGEREPRRQMTREEERALGVVGAYIEARAAELGCSFRQLPSVLTEDVSAEVLVKVWRSIDCARVEDPKAYLSTVIRRDFAARAARAARAPRSCELSVVDVLDAKRRRGATGELLADRSACDVPSSKVIYERLREDFLADQREVLREKLSQRLELLYLFVYDRDEGYAEAFERTGDAQNAVEQRRRRLRRRLGEWFAAREATLDDEPRTLYGALLETLGAR